MKIAAIQMDVVENKQDNIKTAVNLISQAASAGADLVILPEMFCCLYTNESFECNAEPEGNLVCHAMAHAARTNNVYIVAGSIPERDESNIYNTSFVYNRFGERIARHRKVHLFDIDVPGGQRFCESDTFTCGESATVFDTEFGRLGLCICFDMRFPELAMRMTMDGAQAILTPAAFNMTTGPAHWETMFRQRAVDNQVFTVGVAPARDINGPYVSYGHSIVCGPWGNVIASAEADATILYATIDFEENNRIRQQLPLLASRKPKLYEIPQQNVTSPAATSRKK